MDMWVFVQIKRIRFSSQYPNGKCINQVVGINKICALLSENVDHATCKCSFEYGLGIRLEIGREKNYDFNCNVRSSLRNLVRSLVLHVCGWLLIIMFRFVISLESGRLLQL